jgi:hypothetical protein
MIQLVTGLRIAPLSVISVSEGRRKLADQREQPEAASHRCAQEHKNGRKPLISAEIALFREFRGRADVRAGIRVQCERAAANGR